MASHYHHVTAHSVQSLLEKMTSSDKDFRFMAANDLMSELQAENISLDEESEQKVVKMLMRLLEDKNGEVQNLAVRCLGPLANKVKSTQVETIVNTLCANLMSDNEQIRDISSMGLKTVISEITITTQMVDIISRKLTPQLVAAITNAKDVSVQLESLDILTDLLVRTGSQLESYHGNIQEALISQLTSDRLAVRKRAMIALSQLMVGCSLQLYNFSMSQILDQLKSIAPSSAKEISQFASGNKYSTSRTLLQCSACTVRAAGHRSTDLIDNYIPVVQQFCAVPDDELREFCIQVFEAFVRRCPHGSVRYLPHIVKICLETIAYDPNYNYEDNDSDDEEMEMDGPDEDGESAEEYSDDDDMSWKVRRAAAKCIEAIISARQDMVGEFYVTLAPTLISRFKEREESVKVDILQAFISLLRQTRPLADKQLDSHIDITHAPLPIVKLREMIPTIVSKATSQLREKAVKTRQGIFNVLMEIMHVIPGALADHIAPLMPGILYSLADKNSTSSMKIDALSFVEGLLRKHPPHVFHPHIQVLLPAVANAVSDPFYKISSEALIVMTELVRVIRPLEPYQDAMHNFQACIPVVYEKTLEKISATDIDQEVKERAISCMGQVIATFGDHMANELPIALPLLMDRLNNEITRITCVKALTTITNSTLNISFDRMFPDAFLVLASFLRKNQRSLKVSTLVLLDATIKRAAHLLDARSAEHILVEMPPLINESDLHVSQLTLNILTSIIRTHKAFLPIVPQNILPEALQLIRSPLLQGSALKSMLQFFSTIVQSSFPGLDHNALYTRLIEPIYKGIALHKQAYLSTAKAVAAISILDSNRAFQTVRQLIPDMRVYKDKETIHSLGLLIIGEIGKSIDLGTVEELYDTILEAFGSSHEDVKSAASYSLGSVAVGNLQKFLPIIMTEIEARNRRQYLLLHSLREVISCGFVDSQVINIHLEPIWELLLKHCECPEEGTRNVVAECLGKLTLLRPDPLLSRLRMYLRNEFAQSPLARSTVVTAVKFTISDQPQPIDDLLRSMLEEFLTTLQDKDINVRRVALTTFNSAAHNKPSLVRDLLPKVLPRLYEETSVKTDLIREVEMGPFKHTVDDGLDLRKAAFECMYTLLDTCQAQLDIFEFLSHVEDGLKDHYDIKMLTYLMLVRLAFLCPSAVLQRLDGLVEPIRSVCDSKPKANAVKQEYEKQDELKRSALRAFDSLKSIPDAEKNPVVSNFVQKISKDPELLALYKSIQRDQVSGYDSYPISMDVN